MAEIKTKATAASIDDYLASRASPEQLADCHALMKMLKRVTKEPAKMWGPSIVGYGKYTYRYDSGHTGEMCTVGFAIRGREMVLYLIGEGEEHLALRAKLGKHKMGKSCLYFKRLADLDTKVLEALVVCSLKDLKLRHTTVSTT